MKLGGQDYFSADHKKIRLINRANVLNIIREKTAVSRAEISRILGLKKSTISSIVGELIDENLVYEQSLGQSAIGRKPVILRLNEGSRIIGCIDVRHGETVIAVCDLGGKILKRKTVPTKDGKKFFVDCGKTLAGMSRGIQTPFAGAGVVVTSLVDHEEGLLYWDYSHGWDKINVKEIVEEQVGCRVFVENDGKAAALAELWFAEEARGLKNFVLLWVCEGIGVGMVFNGELYHGAYSLDGQFGQQLIRIGGKWEEITQENTWEDNASDLGVVKRYNEYNKIKWEKKIEEIELATNKIIDLALENDKNAQQALKETARYLGVGIANIVNGLSPERFIVSGIVTRVWDKVFPELIKQVELQTLYQVVPVGQMIIPSSLQDLTFLGAQAMVLQDFFTSYNLP